MLDLANCEACAMDWLTRIIYCRRAITTLRPRRLSSHADANELHMPCSVTPQVVHYSTSSRFGNEPQRTQMQVLAQLLKHKYECSRFVCRFTTCFKSALSIDARTFRIATCTENLHQACNADLSLYQAASGGHTQRFTIKECWYTW